VKSRLPGKSHCTLNIRKINKEPIVLIKQSRHTRGSKKKLKIVGHLEVKKKIEKKKTAVIPFENSTNDERRCHQFKDYDRTS